MLCLDDGPTLSQPLFPTGWGLVFVLCQLKTCIRLITAFPLLMGEQCWVPLPLCCPDDAPFLGEVALSLEILIVVG